MSNSTLGIFVKQPVPGQVKTRIAAALGVEAATAVYAAFISDVADRFRETADHRVLCFSPATPDAREYFLQVAAGDYQLSPQPEGSLGDRMSRFFEHQFPASEVAAGCAESGAGGRVVLIGSDSPTLPRGFVERAFEALRTHQCVLGPATDGGYYLIGQGERSQPIFNGIDWSTPAVLEQTIRQIDELGLHISLLPPWYDVDTPEDWQLLRGHIRAMRCAGLAPELPQLERLLAWDTPLGRTSL